MSGGENRSQQHLDPFSTGGGSVSGLYYPKHAHTEVEVPMCLVGLTPRKGCVGCNNLEAEEDTFKYLWFVYVNE